MLIVASPTCLPEEQRRGQIRAEAAVRLFKRQFVVMARLVEEDLSLESATPRQVIRKCVWARNSQLMTSGRTPLELAFGRPPPPLPDVETMNPAQLTAEPLAADCKDRRLRDLAARSHLEARQADDLRHHLARNIRPSDGPFMLEKMSISGTRISLRLRPMRDGSEERS